MISVHLSGIYLNERYICCQNGYCRVRKESEKTKGGCGRGMMTV